MNRRRRTLMASSAVDLATLASGPQTQVYERQHVASRQHDPATARPKHPGVAALEAEAACRAALPFPGMKVLAESDLSAPSPDIPLFSAEDAQQALAIFDASAGVDRHRAMLEVMMFSLKLAAINLDVR